MPHWHHGLIQDMFLPDADLLAYRVAHGGLLVGIARAAGLFTWLAALRGVTLNMASLWAGTTSTNPPWLCAHVTADVRRLGREGLFIGAVLVGAGLALVASDWRTWPVLAAAAVVIAAAAARADMLGPPAEGPPPR